MDREEGNSSPIRMDPEDAQNRLIHLDPVPDFRDKMEIKPWLQKIFYPQGIEIVIERSDSLKVVFKCKAARRGRSGRRERPKSGQQASSSSESSAQTVAQDGSQANGLDGASDNKQRRKRCVSRFNVCPFRVRATYSLRRRKWSIVLLNNNHNHELRFDPKSEDYKKFKEKLRQDNDLEAIKKFDELEFRTFANLPIPTSMITCDCGLTNEIKSFDVVLPNTNVKLNHDNTHKNNIINVLENDCPVVSTSMIGSKQSVSKMNSSSVNVASTKKNDLLKKITMKNALTHAITDPMKKQSLNIKTNEFSLSNTPLLEPALHQNLNAIQPPKKLSSTSFLDDPFDPNRYPLDLLPIGDDTLPTHTDLNEIDFTDLFIKHSTHHAKKSLPTLNRKTSQRFNSLDETSSISFSPFTPHTEDSLKPEDLIDFQHLSELQVSSDMPINNSLSEVNSQYHDTDIKNEENSHSLQMSEILDSQDIISQGLQADTMVNHNTASAMDESSKDIHTTPQTHRVLSDSNTQTSISGFESKYTAQGETYSQNLYDQNPDSLESQLWNPIFSSVLDNTSPQWHTGMNQY